MLEWEGPPLLQRKQLRESILKSSPVTLLGFFSGKELSSVATTTGPIDPEAGITCSQD